LDVSQGSTLGLQFGHFEKVGAGKNLGLSCGPKGQKSIAQPRFYDVLRFTTTDSSVTSEIRVKAASPPSAPQPSRQPTQRRRTTALVVLRRCRRSTPARTVSAFGQTPESPVRQFGQVKVGHEVSRDLRCLLFGHRVRAGLTIRREDVLKRTAAPCCTLVAKQFNRQRRESQRKRKQDYRN
jgi:hypothetical protein